MTDGSSGSVIRRPLSVHEDTDMTENVIWQEAPARCRHLRSKQYHVGVNFHPSGTEDGAPLPGWCLKTMQIFGPDSDDASESACTAERSCFEKDGF